MKIRFCVFIVLSTLLAHVAPAGVFDFPGRKKPEYKDVQYIEINELYQDYLDGKVNIVDVRSKLEFDTIHVEGASHIPVADPRFGSKLKKFVKTAPGKKIAFYCNGITCFKAYEAQLRAAKAGIHNCYAFDLGIPGWADKYPDKTVLLGKPLSESDAKFIPEAEFNKKCLSWKAFRKRADQRGVKVIDIRDYMQKCRMTKAKEDSLSNEEREHLTKFCEENKKMLDALGKGRVMNQTVDMLLRYVVGNKRYQNHTLLIFDQVGKQVRWLMYKLEAAGLTNYYFLDNGATGVIGMQR